ncbi:MAG: hypothetical protein EX271_07160 [Acidimicrobiales bacterium]|nr:hypothetical protein [Hyphomonadaceae bacterium]RZV41849.1 MAG: hypothetical protein EX271_07160 [Acidimicrobiales bacterium]
MGRNILKILYAVALMSISTSAHADEVSSGNGVTPNVSTSNVWTFPENVPGTVGISRLFRDKQSVSFEMTTAGLAPDAIYTVWWVIFNDPNACDGISFQLASSQLCDENDLFNPATHPGLIWADGFQASAAGTGSFSATLLENDTTGDQPFASFGLDNSLLNAAKAEVHVVLRSHGAPGIGGVDIVTQLTNYDIGCSICVDTHFAAHPKK